MSWRHVSPSHTRTRRRKRRLRRQRSHDDERAGLHTTTNALGSTRRRTSCLEQPSLPELLVEHAACPHTSSRLFTTTHQLQKLSHRKQSLPHKSSFSPPQKLAPHTHGSRLVQTPLYSAGLRPLEPASLSVGPPLGRGFFPLRQSGQRPRPPLARVTGGAWRGAREIIPRKQAPTLSHP